MNITIVIMEWTELKLKIIYLGFKFRFVSFSVISPMTMTKSHLLSSRWHQNTSRS